MERIAEISQGSDYHQQINEIKVLIDEAIKKTEPTDLNNIIRHLLSDNTFTQVSKDNEILLASVNHSNMLFRESNQHKTNRLL